MEKFNPIVNSTALHSVVGLRKLCSFLLLSASVIFAFSCEKSPEAEVIPSAETSRHADAKKAEGMTGINVLLNTPVTNSILKELGTYGRVVDVIPEIKALTMKIPSEKLSAIQRLSFVDTANPDAKRTGAPIDAVSQIDFSDGLSTWNLDAINVTELGEGRTIAQDATGVFIGILDSGLLDSWRQYFPQERVATQYAKSFGGGGGENGNVSEQPNKWEHDQNSHGTHVASTILGFQLGNAYFNGVAPKATIIPVKVLNQNGSGWSSVIARGIVYMAELKAGPLSGSPVVINMSLGGSQLDAIEKAAIDYAIGKGVIIVASAGNSGEAGMGYPGAYEPVISVAMAGWKNQWSSPSWWYASNVPDPTNPADFFIDPFSSREKSGQDLDVTAPGTNVVGPYQLNSGQLSYYYLTGTSMASPHVAGIVALMAQQNPSLTPEEAETALENAAIPMGAGSRIVNEPDGTTSTISWGDDATGHGFITADAALSEIP
ncbi:MAG TPA: S8 family serine peptidase [Cytophagales bacterium]|nr:S8 family serine peptidase [Cytophagales bacterium]